MGKATASHQIPAEQLELYDRLIATQSGVERKGATMPYTSVNGHMFSFLTEAGILALRLPPDDREAFLHRYGTTLHQAHGTVMKEYVKVPGALLADTEQLRPWYGESYAYAAALRPKPARRRA